jgi:hypothetical protein
MAHSAKKNNFPLKILEFAAKGTGRFLNKSNQRRPSRQDTGIEPRTAYLPCQATGAFHTPGLRLFTPHMGPKFRNYEWVSKQALSKVQ